MGSKKTDFTKKAIEAIQEFRDRAEKSKYSWVDPYYEQSFAKIERALENGRWAMKELEDSHLPDGICKANQSGVALREAVTAIRNQNKMYGEFMSRLNTEAAEALRKFPGDKDKVELDKHNLLGDAARVYSSMTTVLHDMEHHLPKRQKPILV